MNTQRELDLQMTNNRVTRKYAIAGIVIVAFFFGGLGTWAAVFPLSGAVIAPGVVKVSMERQTIQHLEGGIVDKITVREGDAVQAGQVLVYLKSSQADASVSLLTGQLWRKLAESVRLKAEGLLAKHIIWPEELNGSQAGPGLKKILDEEQWIFLSHQKDLAGKILLNESQIEQLKEKIIGDRKERIAHEKIIFSLNDELASKQLLFEKGYIGKTQVLTLERMLADHEGQSGRLQQVIAESRHKIEELKLGIIDLKNTYQNNAINELSLVNEQIFEIREKLKPEVDQKKRLKIEAPISGIVLNLQIHSEDSGVVQPGQPLMDIVPENAELIIETKVRTDQITKVKEGQAAKVQLTAFNRREIVPIEGIVTHVSADLLTERTADGEMPFYLTHIEILEQVVKESGAYLSPGMPAVCYITTESRSIIDYMLEPIIENLDKALRESN